MIRRSKAIGNAPAPQTQPELSAGAPKNKFRASMLTASQQ
jgi:hypothetical protein